MADFADVPCPRCQRVFMVGEEFFRLPDAYCHCPYCATEFRVGVAANQAPEAGSSRSAYGGAAGST
jgi:hypothetical protein